MISISGPSIHFKPRILLQVCLTAYFDNFVRHRITQIRFLSRIAKPYSPNSPFAYERGELK
jgi:hypothetical protein